MILKYNQVLGCYQNRKERERKLEKHQWFWSIIKKRKEKIREKEREKKIEEKIKFSQENASGKYPLSWIPD